MIYLMIIVVILSTLNVVVSLFNLKVLRDFCKITNQDEQCSTRDEHNIHDLLNNRLLDLQNKKYGFQQYDVTIVSDNGHKNETTNAKAHGGKKNIKIENGQYVLLEYSELNSGTFYITDAYQAQDVEILKQQGFIPVGNDKMDTD